MSNQSVQIWAVHRRIAEATSVSVTMSVKPCAAYQPRRAYLAILR